MLGVFVYREKFLLTQLVTGINHQYNYVSTEVGMANIKYVQVNIYQQIGFSREVW